MTAIKRRLELLKLEGLGFSPPEIVTELSQKYQCSGPTVYRDFESRGQWQPELQNVKNHAQILLRTVNRYEQIYREASVRLLTGTQELTQLGALNIACMHKVGFEFVCQKDDLLFFRKRK